MPPMLLAGRKWIDSLSVNGDLIALPHNVINYVTKFDEASCHASHMMYNEDNHKCLHTQKLRGVPITVCLRSTTNFQAPALCVVTRHPRVFGI